MNCFTAIFFVLQITFTFKDKVIKDPVIESFEQINDQIWYPFIQAYEDLDTDSFIRLHSSRLVRMDLNEGMQYDIDSYYVQQKEINDYYKANKKRRTIDLRFQHRTVQDSFAYEIGYYKATSYVHQEPKGIDYYGKFNVILKKENGYWKIILDADHGEIPSYLYRSSMELEDLEPFKDSKVIKRRYR